MMTRLLRNLAWVSGLLLLLVACGGGEKLDDRVLQLSVTYTSEGAIKAEMVGDRGAATSGKNVECRLTTGDKPIVGQTTANEFGAFQMALDHTAFPERIPSGEAFKTFNETIECRPRGGSWVSPLRQPLIRVN